MNIIKPYEWDGVLYGHSKEESILIWNNVWEFINTIDIPKEFKYFSNNIHSNDLNDFMDYIEKRYEYHDCIGNTLFNMIDTEDFSLYLKNKYQNFIIWVEIVETHRFKFN